jgi:hypothetical protein
MFDELLQKVQVAYECCPAYLMRQSLDVKPSFERFVSLYFVCFSALNFCNTGNMLFLVSRRQLLSVVLMNPICLVLSPSFLAVSSQTTFSLKQT